MAKYCKYCGNSLEEGQECSCQKKDIKENTKPNLGKLNKFAENIGLPSKEEQVALYERGKKIVPDCIVANEGEIPVRQYNIAKLRSVSKCAFGEGRLQVTNKRVIFRSSGFSLLGQNQIQHEFSIDEIAGIEIRNDHRLGVFHMLIGWAIITFLFTTVHELFQEFANIASFIAGIASILLFLVALYVFLATKGKAFIKLILSATAFSALAVEAFSTKFFVVPVLNASVYGILEAICLVLLLVSFVMIAFVPNLVLEIKTKSASSPIEIRRKESNGIMAFLFNIPKKDYTGYSDVMPGEDLSKAKKELGALINDINMLGDAAIEKWKEN